MNGWQFRPKGRTVLVLFAVGLVLLTLAAALTSTLLAMYGLGCLLACVRAVVP